MENNKLNGFNNGRDTTDGVGGKELVTIYEHPINEKPDAYVVGLDLYQEEYKPSLQEAVEVICNALREDTTEGSYYYSWQANIAMAFYDEYCRYFEAVESVYDKSEVHLIANEAAKNFLNLLIS